jgi:hypothetical protein
MFYPHDETFAFIAIYNDDLGRLQPAGLCQPYKWPTGCKDPCGHDQYIQAEILHLFEAIERYRCYDDWRDCLILSINRDKVSYEDFFKLIKKGDVLGMFWTGGTQIFANLFNKENKSVVPKFSYRLVIREIGYQVSVGSRCVSRCMEPHSIHCTYTMGKEQLFDLFIINDEDIRHSIETMTEYDVYHKYVYMELKDQNKRLIITLKPGQTLDFDAIRTSVCFKNHDFCWNAWKRYYESILGISLFTAVITI